MTLQRKAFSDIITFSRASNATVTGSDGLIQYAPHNLLTYSQEFDNAAWAKTNVTVSANAAAAPDGTVTADKLIATATLGAHYVNSSSVSVGGISTVSVYAKAGEYGWLFVQLSGAGSNAYFDLNNGIVGSTTDAQASITNVGNGWYRCSFTDTTAASPVVVLCPTTGNGISSYTGDGVSGIYIWGAQLSVGPRALSYTPTTSAAVYGPRFDYDPVSMAPKGLLVEEQRTNLLTYSEQFDNATWVKGSSTVTANAAASPDGTVTADKLVESAITDVHFARQDVTTTAQSYTFSVFAKAAERSWLQLNNTTVAGSAFFDIANGVVGTTSSATATITPAGNGWYKCTITVTATAAANAWRIYLASSNGTTSYTGDGTSGIYIWGAQLEAGAFATSYIPTVASQVTRSADVASINTLSPWYNATEGSIYSEVLQLSNATASMSACLNDGTTANEAYLRQISGTFQYNYVVGAVAQCALTPISTSAQGVIYKIAGVYKTDSFAASGNGGTVVTDNAGSVTTFTKLSIGARANSTQPLNGHIRRIAYYPRRLTNSELQALTA